ncbi:MAG: GNAT family N-acetyltransferase [Mesorhizobium sp.]|uniref:GNAT family N-acetyltransferase n=1 Tax=Mesorhizobium sp. TaxID=1871066 RepID=UPI000FE67463|nr:GNAT family N-acetyltransferase [Mesorhizobium sp.]RWI08771.1 MAG: N-acetyltransferase [Mesorhizobium sp.]RWM85786.1 MAG: N-acetyltransferase [Mesorhizobium sp.]TIO17501.1 MAG: GNAT family N-acetyltransferase [Mesorhizobium sp.]TIP90512.1 MAG: GNAT family N-acetyltransferase [Mesorhizobium sp.]
MTAQQITLETMMPEHLDGAVALSRQAKWPHRRENWELALSVSQGIVALEEERVVATIMMTPYGDDAATINMVIVDAAMRGRGLGRKMMEEALASAGPRTCYLVATQEGLPLYEKLGFVTTGEIVQHQGEAPTVEAPDHVSWSESGDHACLVTLDHIAYGHQRSALMRLLRERAKFAVIREENAVQAFAAIREFGRGLVIGPVVARNDIEAKTLIDFLLAHHQGTFVRIDTDVSTDIAEWLTGRGLAHVGGGITMRRGTDAQENKRTAPCRTYALVSQALG